MTESDYYELNTTDTNKSSTGNADFDWNTLEKTNLGFKSTGDSLNIETDIIGKYIEFWSSNINLC